MALDPVNALLGWLTQQGGNAVVGGVRNLVFGDAQQRAFRRVVSAAIARTAGMFGDDRAAFLTAVLTEHHEGLEAIQHHPDLSAAVHALVETLDDPSDPHRVAPPGLAEALVAEIDKGVLDDFRAGGPLAPLMVEGRFTQLLSLHAQHRAALEMILSRQEEILRTWAASASHGYSLEQAYLGPVGEREAIEALPFTGRQWLLTEIDAFIAQTDRGYFVIQADAGTGKSAFAVWCAGQRNWPIHDSGFSADARRIGPAVRNVITQLIKAAERDGDAGRAARLHDLVPGHRLPAEADWSSLLRKALAAAAPVTVLVDGLDEADHADRDSLPFGLPDSLPAGVHIVVTVRTGGLPHQPRPPVTVCDWNNRTAQQRADMRRCLVETVSIHLADLIAADGMDRETFIEVLLDRCGDVWLYLHYVVSELLNGTSRPRHIPALPRGLDSYYHNTVERLLRNESDRRWRMPLLATLAVAREPLTAEMLTRLSGLDDRRQVSAFLSGRFRSFCAAGTAGRWRLKHGSLNAYLADGPSPDHADTADMADNVRSLRAELADESRAAHRRIADYYLDRWGGLAAGLPELAADPALAKRDDGYPLRALVEHLIGAGRDADVHRLLACGTEEDNTWYAAHDAAGRVNGFLTDVAAARGLVEDSGAATGAERVSLRIRYALIEASVASATTNVTPGLLEVLVERGRWSIARAFDAVAQMTDADRQAEALLSLVRPTRTTPARGTYVPDELVPQAWALALSLHGGRRLAEAAVALIDRLPDDMLHRAVKAVAAHAQEPWARTAAARLTRRLPADRLRNFPFSEMPAMAYNDQMLVHSVPPPGAGTAQSALRGLDRQWNEFLRGQDLAEIVPYLPTQAFDDAIAVVERIPARYRSDPLIALARWAPAERLSEVLALALDGEAAWEGTPPEALQQPWSHLMRVIGPRLTGPAQERAAVAVCRALSVAHCAAALEALAPCLSARTARDALRDVEACDEFEDEPVPLMIAVGALAARLPDGEARAMVDRYIATDDRVTGKPDIELAERIAPVSAFVHADTARWALWSVCGFMCALLGSTDDLEAALRRLAPRLRTDPSLFDAVRSATQRSDAWQPAVRLVILDILAPYVDDETLNLALRHLLPGPLEPECFAALAGLTRTIADDAGAGLPRRGFDTIAGIGNDRLQVKAVAALAPCLPGPVAVEALEFVASRMSVQFPAIVAALDALAPQLPGTALPRALEILVHIPKVQAEDVASVPRLMRRLGRDDPSRAIRHHLRQPGRNGETSWPQESWIWAVAPYLDPELAREALQIAPGEPQYARRVWLAALAPRLPRDLRPAVVREALGLLDVAPHTFAVRLRILARIAEADPTEAVTAACRTAAADLVRIADNADELDARADFLAHLPDGAIDVALDASARRLYLVDRCRILTPLVPRLPTAVIAGLVADLEAADREWGADETERERALDALAYRTQDAGERNRILTGLLDGMTRRRSWYIHGPALLDMIPQAPAGIRASAVALALPSCFNGYDGGDPATLVELLDGDELLTALDQARHIEDRARQVAAIAAVLRRNQDLSARQPVLTGIDPLTTWPRGATRAQLFTLIDASARWIRSAGGSAAATATAEDLLKIALWWR